MQIMKAKDKAVPKRWTQDEVRAPFAPIAILVR
jgi:hypothetical protein